MRHCAPAVILAVSLFLGAAAGRFATAHQPGWFYGATTAAVVLALAQPSPVALGAVGVLAGIGLEASRNSRYQGIQEIEGADLTVAGRVVDVSPALYGQTSLTVKVSEIVSDRRTPLKFQLTFSACDKGNLQEGSKVLLRSVVKKTGSAGVSGVIAGRTVSGGWLTRPRTFSAVARGRERLLALLDGSRCQKASACGLLAAITLGERWRVDAKSRDVLRRTGTYHLLAISGVHVAAAIFPVVLLVRLIFSASRRTRPRMTEGTALVLSFGAVANYITFTGTSSSALRALVYYAVVSTAVLAGRSSLSLASLSWCAVLIAFLGGGRQPDVSLVLSVLAVTGIILAGRGKGRFIGGLLRMTMGALLFTLPLSVMFSGGISILAPVGNILAGVPFGLFLIPCAVLLDAVALFPQIPLEPLLDFWKSAAGPVMVLLGRLAELDFCFLPLGPEGRLIAALSSMAGIVMWTLYRFRLREGMVIFLLIIVLSGGGQKVSEFMGRDDLVIHFPRVGQADAAIISHRGKNVLIDCGPPAVPGRDSPVAMALQRLGVGKVDAVFLTHPHPDHTGGLSDILGRWDVQALYIPAAIGTHPAWQGILGEVTSETPAGYLDRGENIEIGYLKFRVMGPERPAGVRLDANEGSLQLMLVMSGFNGLFTGDASWGQVAGILMQIPRLELFKVPHHGSRTGFPPPGLEMEMTRLINSADFVAVCPSPPAGRGNLPAPDVVRWFQGKGARFIYTGENGVKIRYKGGQIFRTGPTVIDNDDLF